MTQEKMTPNDHESLRTALARGRTLVLDGALATELERRGEALHPTLWSADSLRTAPHAIQSVHEDYILAGANIITTATYQASATGFLRDGRSLAEAIELMKTADQLATDARTACRKVGKPQPIYIASSIGTYGAFTADGSEYTGQFDISRTELEDYHSLRWELACEGPSDVLALETLPSLIEIEVLMNLLDRTPDKEAWVSLSCPNGKTLADGTSLETVAAVVGDRRSVLALGVNCLAPALVEGLLRSIRGVTDLPLIAYANSGEVWDSGTRNWLDTAPARPVDTGSWRAIGCQIIGGCCRTTPDDIEKLAEALD